MIIHKNFGKENNEVNFKQGCAWCGKPFADDEKWVRVDIETSESRGDDEVFNYHKVPCFGLAKGVNFKNPAQKD